MSVTEIAFSDLNGWEFDHATGNLNHESGRFFSIIGVDVRVDADITSSWQQPIIYQPEIGILGFLTRIENGVRKFLVQAKLEPGNINQVQICPTVQATYSNFTAVHRGIIPPYLDYFHGDSRSNVLCDRLQSEQGARFLRKRNRNMIVEIDHEPDLYDDFFWLTYPELAYLFKINNIINMDARSVLSNLSIYPENSSSTELDTSTYPLSKFGYRLCDSLSPKSRSLHTLEELELLIRHLNTVWNLSTTLMPLKNICNWEKTERGIHHISQSYFSIIAVDVQANSREVSSWTQPMLKDLRLGLVGFICQVINEVLHFLIQLKIECGNKIVVEISPTVACSNFEERHRSVNPPQFLDILVGAPNDQIRFEEIQSEEGGRFFHLQNIQKVVELPEGTHLDLPINYSWVTLWQLMDFQSTSMLNIDSRSLLARLIAGIE